METIRNAYDGEMHNILDCINVSFSYDRHEPFDISDSQPKVYKNTKDFSNIHNVYEKDNEICCVVGNLKNNIEVDNKLYPFSVIGSVSTLPEFRNKGYMTKTLQTVIDENKKTGIVFSVLTGLRRRYNNFGFEKCGFRYYFSFDQSFCKYQKQSNITIAKFENKYLNKIFDIYASSNHYIKRTKQDFILTLQTSYSQVFVILTDSCVIGYFTYSSKKQRINEFKINDLSYLEETIAAIIKALDTTRITFVVNPLEKDYVLALDKICEEKLATEQLHFLVYDMVRFLEMLIAINKKVKKIKPQIRVVCIDGENICIEITQDSYQVYLTDKKALEKDTFTQKQFLRQCLGLISMYDDDDLFPLLLDINYTDLF